MAECVESHCIFVLLANKFVEYNYGLHPMTHAPRRPKPAKNIIVRQEFPQIAEIPLNGGGVYSLVVRAKEISVPGPDGNEVVDFVYPVFLKAASPEAMNDFSRVRYPERKLERDGTYSLCEPRADAEFLEQHFAGIVRLVGESKISIDEGVKEQMLQAMQQHRQSEPHVGQPSHAQAKKRSR
jgi:hypothetical protein